MMLIDKRWQHSGTILKRLSSSSKHCHRQSLWRKQKSVTSRDMPVLWSDIVTLIIIAKQFTLSLKKTQKFTVLYVMSDIK